MRRAAFAFIAGYTVHGKDAPDEEFLPVPRLIERHATDRRNFVKKAVNWALRQIGKRLDDAPRAGPRAGAKLAASDDTAARWIGKDAVKELTDAEQLERLASRSKRKSARSPRGPARA